MHTKHDCSSRKTSEYGGAAIEYIIVSAVGLIIASAASAFIVGAFKEKLDEIATHLEVEGPEINLPF